MKSFILLNLIFISFNFSNSYAKDCLSQLDEMGNNWAKQPIRTQGGGWVWFLGKGINSKKSMAEFLADGIALSRIKDECSIIPKSTRIVEKCYEIDSGSYLFYSRASYRGKDCKLKKEHKTLSKKLSKYESYTLNSTVESCTKKNPKNCEDLGNYEYLNGDKEKGVKLFSKGCLYGNSFLCIKMAILNKDNKKKINYYLGKACDQKNTTGCMLLGELSKNKKYIIEKLSKHCSDGITESCLFVADKIPNDPKDFSDSFVQLILKKLEGYCEDGYRIACFQKAEILRTKLNYGSSPEEIKQLKKYYTKACLNNKKGKLVDQDWVFKINLFFGKEIKIDTIEDAQRNVCHHVRGVFMDLCSIKNYGYDYLSKITNKICSLGKSKVTCRYLKEQNKSKLKEFNKIKGSCT